MIVMISGIDRRLNDRCSLGMSNVSLFQSVFLSFPFLSGALKTVQRLLPGTPRIQNPNSD